MDLSVIIPTKNRPVDLELTVQSVLLQSLVPHQLIIVDQSQDDESRKRVEKQYEAARQQNRATAELRYIHDPSISGLAVARNRAMAEATEEIWVFLDDDVWLEPAFLEELMSAYLQHPRMAGVSGIVTNYRVPSRGYRLWYGTFVRGPFYDERQPIYWKAERLRNSEPIVVRKLGGGLMSFRAMVIRKLRFDEKLLGVAEGEDVDFCFRLGQDAVLAIAPRARLVHKRSVVGRSREHWLRREAQAAHYLYKKNWNRNIRNWLCFVWLNVGYALLASVGSLRRVSLDPWRALIRGVRAAGLAFRRS